MEGAVSNIRRTEMNHSMTLSEAQMIDTFGKMITNKVKILTTTGEGIFDEFEVKGCSFLGTYDPYGRRYYIMRADAQEQTQKKPGGTIITIRTKRDKKSQRQLEVIHS
jgi:hypothetical protein